MKIEKNKNRLLENTTISDIFIKEYLPGLPPMAVKLYLYLLYAEKQNNENTEESLAMILNSDISVVNETIILLESTGLILRQNDNIVILNLVQKEIERNYRLRSVSRPDDINLNSREVNYLRAQAQKAISDKFFSGQMPVSWYNEIDTWFHNYGFEPDVVVMLFQHCYNNHVMTKPYIRKVAESWGEKYHIRTAEQLETYINSYDLYKGLKNELLKRLKWRRNMNVYEEEIVEKWFYTYKYDIEIIDIALKKSVSKNNATLATFDAIITSWYKNGLKTKEEIEQYEEERRKIYAAAKKPVNSSGNYTDKKGISQKENFTQRNYDDDFLNSFFINEDKEDKIE